MHVPAQAESPLDRRPFGGATGQGVRVGVIDSGVHAGHPHIGRLAGGVSINPDGQIRLKAYEDLLGHGTAVMAAIQEKAPAADYFAIQVFHNSLRTSTASLLRAIEWCMEHRMDVVNLSLGSLNSAHAKWFEESAERAAEAGTLLVAAREANEQLCYPGCLPSVFSVGLDWDCPRNQYRCAESGEDTVFYASGYPRPAPGVPPARNLNGISFAVANMSAFVALACEKCQSQDRAARGAAVRRALLERNTFELSSD